ncbi:unnamed protein product [Caenorhabditis bovis]|uniref:Uncharacterized protein n=1 Tax=Caenorhabditis bovis TaxID=2654633 RepID=A0A8S1EA95_9PELO|nr:unnamed protein product [Caenorhabditis bovis]
MVCALKLITFVLLLHFVATFPYTNVRDIPEKRNDPEWNSLGWAWGKRNVPSEIPRRFLRTVHAVKKNPEWHDLGWTWGK